MKNTKLLSASSDHDISLCAKVIQDGGLVAFPTETVYGLGADGLNADAVSGIFRAKGRPQDNPLILHVSDVDRASLLYSDVPDVFFKLTDVFWPGPLTLIYKKSPVVPDVVSAGLDTVALRMPDNPCALRLIRECSKPLAAPSANISGRPSPTNARHVMNDLDGRIDAVLDGGECRLGVESTVLSLMSDVPVILRPGAVTPNMLCAVIGEVDIAPGILNPHDDTTPALSPGMKHKHYAPDADVYVVSGDESEIGIKAISAYDEYQKSGLGCIILGSIENEALYAERKNHVLGSRKNPESFCAELFSKLRLCEEYDVVLCEALPMDDMGLAYMNRLLRAAEFKVI